MQRERRSIKKANKANYLWGASELQPPGGALRADPTKVQGARSLVGGRSGGVELELLARPSCRQSREPQAVSPCCPPKPSWLHGRGQRRARCGLLPRNQPLFGPSHLRTRQLHSSFQGSGQKPWGSLTPPSHPRPHPQQVCLAPPPTCPGNPASHWSVPYALPQPHAGAPASTPASHPPSTAAVRGSH